MAKTDFVFFLKLGIFKGLKQGLRIPAPCGRCWYAEYVMHASVPARLAFSACTLL